MNQSGDRLTISAFACFLAAVMLLLLPLDWLLSVFLASSFHELCHYLAVRLCGGVVYRMSVDVSGAKMEISPLPPGKELVCALAGPFGSGLLATTVHFLPLIGLCGLAQGAFNLIPVYPLDGGRALRCGLQLLLPERKALMISNLVGLFFAAALSCAGLWFYFGYKMVLGLMLPAVLLPGAIRNLRTH